MTALVISTDKNVYAALVIDEDSLQDGIMPRYILDLDICAETYLSYYQGRAATVFAVDRQGRRLRFPATALRNHITHTGIRGTFCLETDDNHRLVGLYRLGALS